MRTEGEAEKRLYEIIAGQLEMKINSGELSDGSRLPSERELAVTFNASRSSVREALLSLQSAGLITLNDRSRAKVTRMRAPAFFDQLSSAARTLTASQ